MDEAAISVLLGVQASLVAALIFVVKWLVQRSDRTARVAERHIADLISTMQEALQAFQRFEIEESATHAKIVETQKEILVILERLESKLDREVNSPNA